MLPQPDVSNDLITPPHSTYSSNEVYSEPEPSPNGSNLAGFDAAHSNFTAGGDIHVILTTLGSPFSPPLSSSSSSPPDSDSLSNQFQNLNMRGGGSRGGENQGYSYPNLLPGNSRRSTVDNAVLARAPSSGPSSANNTRNAGMNGYRASRIAAPPITRRTSSEDALEVLRKYDTIIVVDDSYSMIDDDRWNEASSALAQLADIARQYDSDGIDIHFLNSTVVAEGLKSRSAVNELFRQVQPSGITPLGDKLDELLRKYLRLLDDAKRMYGDDEWAKKIKPRNYIVITDGEPSDDPAEVIISTARHLDQGGYPLSQVGIQFVQIGDSEEATEYLRSLDDDLVKSNVRDMVDTTPYQGTLTSEMIIKILLGGINRRHDKKKI